jgi:hypothetical protein
MDARAPSRGSSDPAVLREQVIEALGIHFAQGDLEMEELENRLALAFRTNDPVALRELVGDLPAALPDEGDAYDHGARGTRVEPVPDRGVQAAIMGGTERKGSWAVPRHLKVVAIMGGVELDLRQAIISSGVTEIEVFAIMGGVEIIVPPGVRVESMGVAIMGGFEVSAGDATALDQPLIRVSGLAIMAGVEAKHRRPSAKAIRKFERAVAKARRTAR